MAAAASTELQLVEDACERMQRRPRVVVAHPGRQHSHQLALGLAAARMLRQYITGVPVHEGAGGPLLCRFLRTYASVYRIPLDAELVRHLFVSALVQKAVCRWLPRRQASSLAHRAEGWFDRLVANRVASLRPDVVVAYENSALHTFRAARTVGAVTVLDAASFHHAWQDRFYEPVESARAHRRIIARKDAEISLADHVLTVSELARSSYLDAGAPADRVHAAPMGVSLKKFKPRTWAVGELAARELRFAFVGHLDERKGIDVLAAAMGLLGEASKKVSLSLFGKRYGETDLDDVPNVKYRGWLPQADLAGALAEHDVLVLPSRHDSFGMVVAEAMACGLPVIVSDHVGARCMVTPRVNGLVVTAGDAESLAQGICWFIEHRSSIPLMGAAARDVAEQYSWEVYRLRAVNLLRQIAATK